MVPDEGRRAAVSSSPLVSYTRLSPNRTVPRNHAIDRITIHCTAGQSTAVGLGAIFAPPARRASCNYGIGKDGAVALICPEKDRSWCSSSHCRTRAAVPETRGVAIEVPCM